MGSIPPGTLANTLSLDPVNHSLRVSLNSQYGPQWDTWLQIHFSAKNYITCELRGSISDLVGKGQVCLGLLHGAFILFT